MTEDGGSPAALGRMRQRLGLAEGVEEVLWPARFGVILCR